MNISWAKSLSLLSGLSGVSYFGLKALESRNNSSSFSDASVIDLDTTLDKFKTLKHESSTLRGAFRSPLSPSQNQPLKIPSQSKLSREKRLDLWYKAQQKARLPQLRKEAEGAFLKINDYSFRLWAPCSMGTGWILDYQLPDREGAYPTTWYIATNAHVIQRYRFGSNPYNQELPYTLVSTKSLRDKDTGVTPEKKKYELNRHNSCKAASENGYFDFSLAQEETGPKLKADKGLVSRGIIREPKLFYVPINFLENIDGFVQPKNNHRDFAVLEIEFTSEDYAREYTNNFATKYDVATKNAINIFSEPLDSRYASAKKLYESQERFYTLAYPWKNPELFKYSKNFDEETGEGSTLSWDAYWLSGKKQLFGHVDNQKMEEKFSSIKTAWGKERLNGVGHLYIVKNFAFGGGSSGGLYTDKDGNLLGIKRLYEGKVSKHSFIVPLRSNKLVINGVVESPEYDLIKGGAKGQLTSYRQQLEKYILGKKVKNTWLSARNWEHKS